MPIRANGVAQVKLLDGKTVNVQPDELHFEPTSSSERGMGTETTYSATVDFDDDASITWEVTEYPVGAFNSSDTHGVKAMLVSDFNFSFEHDPD